MRRLPRASVGVVVSLVAALGPSLPPLAAAPVPLGDVFAANVVETGNESGPTVAIGGSDDFIVLWSRSGTGGDGSGQGIFGRAFLADGTGLVESPFNTFTTGDQTQPHADMNSSRDYTLVWASFNQANGTSNYDIIARQSSSNGTSLGGEFFAEQTTTGGSLQNAVSSDVDDGFVVAWSRNTSVVARQFAAGGVPSSDEVPVAGVGSTGGVDVAADGQRNFLVVYQDADGDGTGVFARRFDEGGVNPSAAFRVNADTTNTQYGGKIAMASNGEFVVFWEETHVLPTFERVEGRRFSADGEPIGGDFQVSPEDGNTHVLSGADANDDGSMVVTWTTVLPLAGPVRGDTGPSRVMTREYQRTGQPVDDAAQEASQSGSSQGTPAVAVGLRQWVVAWIGPDAFPSGTFARRYLRRAIFADDFEGASYSVVWSSFQVN